METLKTFELSFPIDRPHAGMVMGNGNFGAMIWGLDRLCVTVGRSDFWSREGGEMVLPGQTYRSVVEAHESNELKRVEQCFVRRPRDPNKPRISTRVPMGRFDYVLRDGLRLDKAQLEYETGLVRVYLKNAVGAAAGVLRLCMDARRPALLIADPTGALTETIVRPARNEWAREWWEKLRFPVAETYREGAQVGWAQGCLQDPSLAAVGETRPGLLAIALELGKDNAAAFAAAKKTLKSVLAEDPARFEENVAAWWRAYWKDIAAVNLPDDFLNRFFKLALYKFGAATSPEGGMPAGLQGPWVEEYQGAQWCVDYHFNVNIQQIYSPAFPAGKLDHLRPLFDMIFSEPFMTTCRDNARNLFGIEDGILLTHAVDDHGRQCGGIGSGSALDIACGGWTAQLFWHYYKHTGDVEFLRTRAFPFIRGVVNVFAAMLEERDGRLSIPLSISAEYGVHRSEGASGNTGRDPSYQLACARMLAGMAIEACEALGQAPNPFWKEMLAKVPPFTIVETMSKEKHIAIWEGQDLEICHRHHSHLACVYPFDTLGDMDPATAKIVDDSIDHWILKGMGQWSEWCYPWAIIIQARMGFEEAPAVLFDIWKNVFINEGMTTAYLPRFRGLTAHRKADMLKPKATSEVMQLDGTMIGVTAICELLAHTHQGMTKVFPAATPKWRDIDFENVRVADGVSVSASRRDGRTLFVRLTSPLGGEIKLTVKGWASTRVVRETGDISELALPGALKLAPGETVTLWENAPAA